MGSSSCCMTQITPSLSCWTLGLTFDYTKIDIWHTKFQIHWLQGVHILWLLKKPKSSPRCLQLIWGVCADVLCRELLHICICCIWSAFMSKCQTLWFFSKKSNFEALTNFLFVIHVGLTFDTSRQCCRYDACKWKLSRKNTANKNGLFFYGLLYFHIDFYCGLLFSCTYFWYCISLNVSAPVVFKCAAWIICGSFYYLIWLYTADQPQQKAGLTAWKGSNNSFKSETLINVHAQIWFSG